jgi:hypothetical protein
MNLAPVLAVLALVATLPALGLGLLYRRTGQRLIVLNLPVVAAAAIAASYLLWNAGVLPQSEESYGYFVVVLLPLAAALVLAQGYLWVWAARDRVRRRGRSDS